MTIGRIMDYIEARLEAIKSREEEEDEDEEKEKDRERDRERARQSVTPTASEAKSASRRFPDKSQQATPVTTPRLKEQVCPIVFLLVGPHLLMHLKLLSVRRLRSINTPHPWCCPSTESPPVRPSSVRHTFDVTPPTILRTAPPRSSTTQDPFVRNFQGSGPRDSLNIHRPFCFRILFAFHSDLKFLIHAAAATTTITVSVSPVSFGAFGGNNRSDPAITSTTTRAYSQYRRNETKAEYHVIRLFDTFGQW